MIAGIDAQERIRGQPRRTGQVFSRLSQLLRGYFIVASILRPGDTAVKLGARTLLVSAAENHRPGEIFGFVGRNGAGKTSTIRW